MKIIKKLAKKQARFTKLLQLSLSSFSHNTKVTPTRRMRAANKKINRTYGENQMNKMEDYEFERHFRMSKSSFDELLRKLEPDILGNTLQATRSSGSAISPKTKLAVTLRWLAGGSYLDLTKLYGISERNFFHPRGVLWQTMNVLDSKLNIWFSFKREDLEKAAAGFSKFSYDRMSKCVGAVDGWLLETRQPSISEVGYVNSYLNRKHAWGLVALAACDADMRFTMFSIKCSGATHDALAWDVCNLKAAIDQGLLPSEYHLIGDEAFPNSNQMLVPWSGRGLPIWKDSFNFHLSSMRQCIERAFGLLTKRFGVFWRPLSCRFENWALVGTVCAKLHNFCVERDERITERVSEDRRAGDQWKVMESDNGLFSGSERERPTGDRRRQITSELEEAGVMRPNFALNDCL